MGRPTPTLVEGKPCRKGHTLRYSTTGNCVECNRAGAAAGYAKRKARLEEAIEDANYGAALSAAKREAAEAQHRLQVLLREGKKRRRQASKARLANYKLEQKLADLI